MASLVIPCGANKLNLHQLYHVNRIFMIAQFSSLTISNHSRKDRRISISASMTEGEASMKNSQLYFEQGNVIENGEIDYEEIEGWMRESINEIVLNLHSAPLLLEIYSEKNGRITKLRTEKAAVEHWPVIKAKWNGGGAALPEGVILVEELTEDEPDDGRGIYKIWGILVQVKGVEFGPVCYLLKTCTVRGTPELNCIWSYYIRVTNFSESAESQLTKCWSR